MRAPPGRSPPWNIFILPGKGLAGIRNSALEAPGRKVPELGIRELVIIAAPEAAGFYRMGVVAAGELNLVLRGGRWFGLVYTTGC